MKKKWLPEARPRPFFNFLVATQPIFFVANRPPGDKGTTKDPWQTTHAGQSSGRITFVFPLPKPPHSGAVVSRKGTLGLNKCERMDDGFHKHRKILYYSEHPLTDTNGPKI